MKKKAAAKKNSLSISYDDYSYYIEADGERTLLEPELILVCLRNAIEDALLHFLETHYESDTGRKSKSTKNKSKRSPNVSKV